MCNVENYIFLLSVSLTKTKKKGLDLKKKLISDVSNPCVDELELA